MSLVLFHSTRFADHLTPPGHPERVARAETMEMAARRWQKLGGQVATPTAATRAQLARVHDVQYLDAIAATAGRATKLDPDTFTSPDSHEVALLAAGAATTAVEHVLTKGGRALALVRPPGHHAERGRAMGFCLYNSVAVAAAEALARGLSRVAVVDYDVHHGNGTQWIFYEDPRVLYVSLHQYPFYPGTGAAGDIGRGAGRGFTVNVPLEAGATDRDYDRAFTALVVPILNEFEPELLLVSAGYDAEARDPLGGMRMSPAGYAALDRHLVGVAERQCAGRLVAVTEGGYDLQALAACLDSTMRVMDRAPAAPPTLDGDTRRAEESLALVRAAQSAFWRAI
jgi:acetoin utilization deacetylase AcuC-like enzyme